MKITIQRSTLLERLTQVAKAIGKSTMPILEGVLIESNAEMTLTCSDTHFTILTTLDDYEELEAGTSVIPASKLLEIIRKMPDKPITLEVEDTQATIKCGKTVVKLPVMDAEEFPRRSKPIERLQSIDTDAFLQLIENTKFAVSTNEQTPVLTGVQAVVDGGKLTAIATDRHRLAKQVIDFEGEGGRQYVVPVKALDTVARLKPREVMIGFTENEVHIAADGYRYIASLHDGTYPDTSKIIPQSAQITVTVDTQKLTQTLELAERIVEEKSKVVRLDVMGNELRVTAEHEGSNMEEAIEVKADGNIKLSINAKYLIDALKSIDTEQAEIWFNGAMSPVIIRGKGDETGLQLVLPYRTQG